jgi:hypothetical protein
MDLLNEYCSLSRSYFSLLEDPIDITQQTLRISHRVITAPKDVNIYELFNEKYNIKEVVDELKRLEIAEDYVKYGIKNILPYITIHFNDPKFFDITYYTLTTDSEGHYANKYPQIIQFATSPTDIYIFTVELFLDNILNILQNPNILKIVFDLNAEEKAFKTKYNNVLDLQTSSKISFIKLIYDKLKVNLKKNKKIHIIGWDANHLSQNQLYYSAFDVAWMYKIYEII